MTNEHDSGDEYEPEHTASGTIPERVARLEQWMRDHIRLANRSFSRNDEAHRDLLDGQKEFRETWEEEIKGIKAHLDKQDANMHRYDWIARGVMITLFVIGAIGGAFMNKEGWKLLFSFFHG